MNNSITIELTEEQCNLLLQGLRYVHSSVAYDMFKPTPEATATRQNKLQTIENLVSHLNNGQSTNIPVTV